MSQSVLRNIHWTLPLALVSGLALVGSVQADTILVPGQQPTIQAGIDAAVNGDEVVLADGAYTGAGNVNCNFGGKLITVRSARGNPQTCIIDCEDTPSARGFLFNSGETSAAVLSGITITRGTGVSGQSGAIHIAGSSPTITSCRFVDNHSFSGGAMNCTGVSSPAITDCFFAGNHADSEGGAVRTLLATATPVFTSCVFFDNSCVFVGGAVRATGSSKPVIRRCRFIANTAGSDGGAIHSSTSSIVAAVNCLFDMNAAGGLGGAVWAGGVSLQLINCTFSWNHADHDDPSRFGGAGGALWMSAPTVVTVANCILWNNAPDELVNSLAFPGSLELSFCTIEEGPLGIGLLDMPPMFFDPNGPDHIPGTLDDDFSLRVVSPCIDSGDNSAVPARIVVDLDGNPRFVNEPSRPDIGAGTPPLVDMGCYEFQTSMECRSSACPTDLNGDGIINGLDLAVLLGTWGLCEQ